MNAPNEFEDKIQRRLDGENGDGSDDLLQNLTPEQQHYADAMERLVNRLDAIEPPSPPAGMVDDVMAFLERQEAAQTRSVVPKVTVAERLQEWTKWLVPTIEVPVVLRREGWSIALAAFVIAWFGWLCPQIESSNPETLLQPFTQEMVSFADQVQTRSQQFTDCLESFANQIVEPILKQESSTDAGAQSEANPFNGRRLSMPSHQLEFALQYA